MVESYAALARLNRRFIFAEPFQLLVPGLLGRELCERLRFFVPAKGSLRARRHQRNHRTVSRSGSILLCSAS
jgi:hypothetical protein